MSNSETDDEQWWFNTKTQKPEFGRLTGSLNRIGPFATEEEAKRALEVARERAKQWRTEDESES
jgi:hypothetical protein